MTAAGGRVRVVIPVVDDPLARGLVEPVEITGLVRERAALGQSRVYVGEATQAGISRHYDAFVRYPSGLIEELFGHAAFRLDVDDGIDVGSSWQLAAVLAHALQAQGRLLQRLDEPQAREDVLVWATGRVRTFDMAVGEVGHVREKVRHALAYLSAAAVRGAAVHVFVPFGNLDDMDPVDRAALVAAGVRIQPVRHLAEAFGALGLALPERRKPERARKAADRSWQGNPYPGLQSFTENERAVFFGRERAREECLRLLRLGASRGRPCLLVHGKSGAGKSSLAMAGIVGDVVSHASEGGAWQAAVLRFSGQEAPVSAICEKIAACLAPDGRGDLADLLADDPAKALGVLGKGEEARSLLLVLDQLEQALAFPAGEDLGAFVERLSASGRIWIVATIRTDQLERLDASPAWGRLAADGRLYRLAPPTLFELSEIITQPAALAGLSFHEDDPDLPNALAEMALRSPDSLPLLQFVLERLAARAGTGKISRALLDGIGGFDGAIGHYAESVVADILAAGFSRTEVNRVLAELVRKDEAGEQFLSRSVDVCGGSRREDILHRLIDARLVAADPGPGGTTARLYHESLLRTWPLLDTLVQTHAAEIALRDRLEAQALEWLGSGRDEDGLLHGEARIAQAEALDTSPSIALSAHARDFVARSRAGLEQSLRAREAAEVAYLAAVTGRERLALRHTRVTLAGAAAMALLACAAAWFGYRSIEDSRRAGDALGMTYATLAADRIASGHPVDAVKLALAADGTASAAAASRKLAEDVLARAMSAPRSVSIIRGEGKPALSADARWITTAGEKEVVLWSAQTGERLATLAHDEPVLISSFSDRATVITVSADGTVRFWRTEPAGELAESFRLPKPPGARFDRARLSIDRQRIVTFRTETRDEDETKVTAHLAEIWDAGRGERQTVLKYETSVLLDPPNSLGIDLMGELLGETSDEKAAYDDAVEAEILGRDAHRSLKALQAEFAHRAVRPLAVELDGSLIAMVGETVFRIAPDGGRDDNQLFETEIPPSTPDEDLIAHPSGLYALRDADGHVVVDNLFRSRSSDVLEPDRQPEPIPFRMPRDDRLIALSGNNILVVAGSGGYRVLDVSRPGETDASQACTFLPMVEGERDYLLSVDVDIELPVSLADFCAPSEKIVRSPP